MAAYQIIVTIDQSRLSAVRRSMGLDPRPLLEFEEADASLAGMDNVLYLDPAGIAKGVTMFDNWIIRQAERSGWSPAAVKADVLTTLAHEHRHLVQRQWEGFARARWDRQSNQRRLVREDRARLGMMILGVTAWLWLLFVAAMISWTRGEPMAVLLIAPLASRQVALGWKRAGSGWYRWLRDRFHPWAPEVDAEHFARQALLRPEWQAVVTVTIDAMPASRSEVVFFDR